MARRLLVVHPEQEYDQNLKARDSIHDFVEEFNPAEVFILVDDPCETEDYLGTNKGVWILSEMGEISSADAKRIIDGCTQLTIVGHNFDECHYTAFEAVSKQASSLEIVMPTYASTEGSDFVKISDVIGESCDEYRRSPSDVFHGFVRPFQYFSTEERITLKAARKYVKLLASQAADPSADVYINGRKVCYKRKGGNDTTLSIRNHSPIDFR